MTRILIATQSDIVIIDADDATALTARGLNDRPTCLAADALAAGRVWCGTHRGGVFRSEDQGATWHSAGLAGRMITAIAASPAAPDVVWAGTEPSEMWRSEDGGETWEQARGLEALPSSSEWAFPPRPETHHVRWVACHPHEPGRLWVAIEAGALVSTTDGGHTWRDRVPGGPWDTHELAIHPAAPHMLRVAAGDGYLESDDAGASWRSPSAGLEVGY
ncbi:MAG: WD40/YVTN/BNR-like repeat-containing protein, partial [Gemmatimonadota bacterium]